MQLDPKILVCPSATIPAMVSAIAILWSPPLSTTVPFNLVGPKGEVEMKEGVIAAARHIHMHTSDAEAFGVVDKQRVKIKTTGERAITFENVLVRAHETYALEMHIDVDEGNAAALKNGEMVELIIN